MNDRNAIIQAMLQQPQYTVIRGGGGGCGCSGCLVILIIIIGMIVIWFPWEMVIK